MRRKREKKDMRQAECVGGCVGGVYKWGGGAEDPVQREKPVQGQESRGANNESLLARSKGLWEENHESAHQTRNQNRDIKKITTCLRVCVNY